MKKTIKHLLSFLLLMSLVCHVPVQGKVISQPTIQTTIERFEDGSYLETTIEVLNNNNQMNGIAPAAAAKTITGTKKTSYKGADGTVLWYLSVTGTFSYNGSSATCTSCSHGKVVYARSWYIKSSSVSKSGNSATAKCLAVHVAPTGLSMEYNASVTLKCSASGNLS